jgi:hypothetical protein
MPDPLDEYLAQQEAADLAGWDEHVERRHAARARNGRGPAPTARDRKAVVDELESGSDELTALDNALAAKENERTP